MSHRHPFQVIGFHSCDREVGIRILNGEEHLKPSDNPWDWLGNGIYFWDQDPERGLQYAEESATGKQFNKKPIKIPFVLGAIIELGNCLNLVESSSLNILRTAYKGLKLMCSETNTPLPQNKENNRALDCAVIKYIHQINQEKGLPAYTTIRSAFNEGEKVYPGTSFTARNHIQICVIDPDAIKGYFLPQPVNKFNPYLKKEFILS